MIDREIFAEELLRNGEEELARLVAYGMDNSNGGTAAIRAMARAREEERARCAEIALHFHDRPDKFAPIDPTAREYARGIALVISEAIKRGDK